MTSKTLLPLIVVSGFLLAGCEVPTSGIVTSPADVKTWQRGFQKGAVAPDIPFTSLKGKQTTLETIAAPLTILTFVQVPGDQCCWVSPQLLNLWQRFEGDPVTIAQVTLPSPGCPHGGPGCLQTCKAGGGKLITLCDPNRVAASLYKNPPAGTVVVIQEKKVIASGPIQDLNILADVVAQRIKQYEPNIWKSPDY